MTISLLFLCVCAAVACFGILLGGIGIFFAGIRIANTRFDPGRIVSDFADIAKSARKAAFGINEAGIALAARLMVTPIRHHINLRIINDADIVSAEEIKDTKNNSPRCNHEGEG